MRTFLIVMAAALLLAAGASAQVKPFTLYGQAGLSLPQGDLNDGYKTGYNFGVGLGWSLMPKLEGVGRVGVHRFGSDETGLTGGEMTVMMLGADLKLNAGVPMMAYKPYLFGGAGFARIEVSDIAAALDAVVDLQTGGSGTDTKLYYTFGGGLEMGMLFVEARYVSFKRDDASITYIPLMVGIKF